MLYQRDFGDTRIYQIVEFCGPTHDWDFMLPDIPRSILEANAGWLFPYFWVPRTGRLVFSMQIYVIERHGEIVILDTGVGNGKQRPAPSQTRLNTPMLDWLAGIGCTRESVRHILMTHLHGDHVGWNTIWENGAWRPTFPNATYHVPQDDWRAYYDAYVAGDTGINMGSFADSVMPIFEANLTSEIKPGDILPCGFRALAAPGHSPGQLAFELETQMGPVIFTGDVFHSPIQVFVPEINSRWCELPDVARRTRKRLLTRAAQSDAILFPAHAVTLDGWYIGEKQSGHSLAIGTRQITRKGIGISEPGLTFRT